MKTVYSLHRGKNKPNLKQILKKPNESRTAIKFNWDTYGSHMNKKKMCFVNKDGVPRET
jgi:hypothetical protein